MPQSANGKLIVMVIHAIWYYYLVFLKREIVHIAKPKYVLSVVRLLILVERKSAIL